MDLSFQIEISRSHLEDIENGTESVDLERIDQLASAFSISVSELLEGM